MALPSFNTKISAMGAVCLINIIIFVAFKTAMLYLLLQLIRRGMRENMVDMVCKLIYNMVKSYSIDKLKMYTR